MPGGPLLLRSGGHVDQLPERRCYDVVVKTSAYLQTWHQQRLTKITFHVPKKKAWDFNTN